MLIGSNGGKFQGLTQLNCAYVPVDKAACYSNRQARTIAHELGHALGCQHVHADGKYAVYALEPGMGRSIMGYGAEHFLSAASQYEIGYNQYRRARYYRNGNPSDVVAVGEGISSNIVAAYASDNDIPTLHTEQLREEYTIPHNTLFQIHGQATDPEGDKLRYFCQQNDWRTKLPTFPTVEPSESNVIKFEPTYVVTTSSDYDEDGNWSTEKRSMLRDGYPAEHRVGTYTFWLGVTDGDWEAKFSPTMHRAPMKDATEIKVNIVEAQPFVFTTKVWGNNWREYEGGQRQKITWNNPRELYDPARTYVRISFSPDYGKTWPYVLKECTPNDGECEVYLPMAEVGRVPYLNTSEQVRGGLFKIEIIGEPVYALSHPKPFDDDADSYSFASGGVVVKKSPISFDNLPATRVDYTDGLPSAPSITARSSKGTASVSLVQEESCGDYTYRVWKAHDTAGNEAYFQQTLVRRAAQQLHIHNGTYATLYSEQALRLPEGVEAYTAVLTTSSDRLDLQRIEGTILPARTPVILKGRAGVYPLLPTEEQGSLLPSNALLGTATRIDNATIATDAAFVYYALAEKGGKVAFYRVGTSAIPAGKAYLKLPRTSSSTQALSFALPMGLTPLSLDAASTRYGLDGRPLPQPQPGQIYIEQGKTHLR